MEITTPKVYSVSSLTEKIQSLLDENFDFVWVEGEISNFGAPASGHYYMILKDARSQIRAVMFRLQARQLKFTPENGMNVIAQGRIGVYAPRGEYQLVLDYLEPMGVGALALAFEQLKKKLSAQGVFDESVKRPLPFLPKKVAVITSPTGAAIRDFLKVIHRRFANLEIIVVPVKVQGEGAAGEIIEAIEVVNSQMEADVIVITRGGGSMEDLWEFNNEKLAFAIRRSKIPVVSAVGHEIDVTVADLAADLRAPTPSAAAELLVVEKEALTRRLVEVRNRLETHIKAALRQRAESVSGLKRGLKDPKRRLDETWMRMDELQGRILRCIKRLMTERNTGLLAEKRALILHSPKNLASSMHQGLDFKSNSLIKAAKRHILDKEALLSSIQNRLEALNPLSVLHRGYSITRTIRGRKIIRNAGMVKKGGRIQVILSKGELECSVEISKPEHEL